MGNITAIPCMPNANIDTRKGKKGKKERKKEKKTNTYRDWKKRKKKHSKGTPCFLSGMGIVIFVTRKMKEVTESCAWSSRSPVNGPSILLQEGFASCFQR